jgi:ribosome-binding protein aMBF1 (putative translation factor)
MKRTCLLCDEEKQEWAFHIVTPKALLSICVDCYPDFQDQIQGYMKSPLFKMLLGKNKNMLDKLKGMI